MALFGDLKGASVVSFGAGKDSTALLFMMLERKMPVDAVIFCKTGVEYPETLAHVEQVKTAISVPFYETGFDFVDLFAHHPRTRGPRKGECGYGWPTLASRWCTRRKIWELDRKITELFGPLAVYYVGISAEESHRAVKKEARRNGNRFPLVEWGVTGPQALAYCKSLGFTFGGLYDYMPRVSCWCCSMQTIGALRYLYRTRPELWRELEHLDAIGPRKTSFRPQQTVAQLTERFVKECSASPEFNMITKEA